MFIMGDAAHRHPPSNGLGSNTSIQDGFNLAWKLAAVVKGQAGIGLLDSYSAERAPIARQIVTRANQSIAEFGPIFEALGMDGGVDHEKIQRNMEARADATPSCRKAARGAAQGHRLQEVRIRLPRRRDEPALCLERDIDRRPARAGLREGSRTALLTTTWPGARLPHVWVFERAGKKLSTLDLCGHGQFTLLTGIGGEAWVAAAQTLGAEFGLPIRDPCDRPAPGDRGSYRRLGAGA